LLSSWGGDLFLESTIMSEVSSSGTTQHYQWRPRPPPLYVLTSTLVEIQRKIGVYISHDGQILCRGACHPYCSCYRAISCRNGRAVAHFDRLKWRDCYICAAANLETEKVSVVYGFEMAETRFFFKSVDYSLCVWREAYFAGRHGRCEMYVAMYLSNIRVPRKIWCARASSRVVDSMHNPKML
jgi:hypothetical protein